MTSDENAPASGPIDWALVADVDLVPSITARSRSGAQLSSTLFTLEPGAVVPEHSHPNEEFGYVIAGGITVWCGDDEFDVGPGGSFLVAADQAHRAVASNAGCELLECYSPPRVPTPPPTKTP